MSQAQAATQAVTFDLGRTTAFAGFGVSTWMASPHVAARDALLRALHVRFIRASLPGLVPDAQLPAHVSVADMTRLIDANESPGTDALVRGFGAELQALNIRLDVIFWGMPGPWTHGNAQVHLADPAHLADEANSMTAQILYLHRMGIPPAAVELTNEPNGVWNTQYTPAQYVTLLQLTRRAFDAAGLSVIGIEGPGTSGRPADFMHALVASGATGDLSQYSFHEYDTRTGIEPAGLSVSIDAALQGAPTKPIAITEFSSANPRFHGDPIDPSFDPDYGVSVTGEAVQLLEDGANTLLVWHLEDLPWMTSNSGLLSRTGQVKPMALALETVFGASSPGDGVARPAVALAQVPMVAFVRPGDLVLCAVNMRASAVSVAVRFQGRPLRLAGSMQLFGGAGEMSPDGGGFMLYLPARSVFSIRLVY